MRSGANTALKQVGNQPKIGGFRACKYIAVRKAGYDMEAYGDFAYVYDEFMDNTPYEQWCKYLCESINKYGVSRPVRDAETLLESEKNLVVDLGCGTGTLTQMMYDLGYDMVGVDNSGEMLSVAMEKRELSGSEILYLLQDMRELELYSTVGTVISVCDSVNYILDEEDLLTVFEKVNNYLYPGGLFIFDFNTVYKYEEVIGDTTIAENREDCSFIWENFYHEEEEINEYDLTVFVQEENGLFRRFEENHYQRGYRVETILALLQEAGLETVEVLDADTREAVTAESERVYVVARECMKAVG